MKSVPVAVRFSVAGVGASDSEVLMSMFVARRSEQTALFAKVQLLFLVGRTCSR
jgi:hypothetical protein